MDRKDASLSLKLPQHIDQRLSDLAETTGRTKSFYVREAVLKFLNEMEDIYVAVSRIERPARHWAQEDIEQGKDAV